MNIKVWIRSPLLIGAALLVIFIGGMWVGSTFETKTKTGGIKEWIWRKGISAASTIPITGSKFYNAILSIAIGNSFMKRDDMVWGLSESDMEIEIYDEDGNLIKGDRDISHGEEGWLSSLRFANKFVFGYHIIEASPPYDNNTQYYALQKDDKQFVRAVPWETIGKGPRYTRNWISGPEGHGYDVMPAGEIAMDIFGARDSETGNLTFPTLANTTSEKSTLPTFFGAKEIAHNWLTGAGESEDTVLPSGKPKLKGSGKFTLPPPPTQNQNEKPAQVKSYTSNGYKGKLDAFPIDMENAVTPSSQDAPTLPKTTSKKFKYTLPPPPMKNSDGSNDNELRSDDDFGDPAETDGTNWSIIFVIISVVAVIAALKFFRLF